jgi:hypothetical protein
MQGTMNVKSEVSVFKFPELHIQIFLPLLSTLSQPGGKIEWAKDRYRYCDCAVAINKLIVFILLFVLGVTQLV